MYNNSIELPHVKPLFANFDGHKDRFGNVGKRSLVLEVSEDQYYALKDMGAAVVEKTFDDGSVSYRLPAAINYFKTDGTPVKNPPKVYRIVYRNGKPYSKLMMTVDTIAMLQSDTIIDMSAVLNIWEWDTDNHKMKAYINELYVSVTESQLAAQFADVPEAGVNGVDAPAFAPSGDTEELPF